MALLDISSNSVGCLEFSRGSSGSVLEIVSQRHISFELPDVGGACTYPSENDVRDGTVFGTIYTGNLELPIESDVLLGVQYGSNGTEFTGEASGGGGSFISIVNE